ncbi:MAG: PEP-CTERM sorting domain-containing protein [Gammaproteobacteria bacterium]
MQTGRKTVTRASLALGIALASGSASATTIVFYDFQDGLGNFDNSPETIASGITSATAWSTNPAAPVGNAVFNDSGDAAGGKSIKGLWDLADQYFEFSVTVADGFKLDLSGVSFSERFGGGNVGGGGGGGGGGPKKAFSNGWNLLVNGVEQTSGATGLDSEVLAPGTTSGVATSDSFHAIVLDRPLSITGLTGTIVFRLTGDSPVPALRIDGIPFGTGDWRVDSFSLDGTVSPVPVPAAAWLFGTALGGLALRRRRV